MSKYKKTFIQQIILVETALFLLIVLYLLPKHIIINNHLLSKKIKGENEYSNLSLEKKAKKAFKKLSYKDKNIILKDSTEAFDSLSKFFLSKNNPLLSAFYLKKSVKLKNNKDSWISFADITLNFSSLYVNNSNDKKNIFKRVT